MNTAPVTLDSWLAATIGNPGAPAGKVQFRQVQVVPGENSAQDIHSFCIRRHSDPVPCPRVSGARLAGPPRAAVRVGLTDL